MNKLFLLWPCFINPVHLCFSGAHCKILSIHISHYILQIETEDLFECFKSRLIVVTFIWHDVIIVFLYLLLFLRANKPSMLVRSWVSCQNSFSEIYYRQINTTDRMNTILPKYLPSGTVLMIVGLSR